MNNNIFKAEASGKHKVFISYYHKDDEVYRTKFEQNFGHLFTNESVVPGAIDDDTSAGYIKQLIQKDYLSDASVLVVLVGAKTYCRKHVDWEISGALNKKVNGYSGLLGICLPTHPAYQKDKYDDDTIPERLLANLKSGFAGFQNWTDDAATMKARIEKAFEARVSKADKIDNSLAQYGKNRCD